MSVRSAFLNIPLMKLSGGNSNSNLQLFMQMQRVVTVANGTKQVAVPCVFNLVVVLFGYLLTDEEQRR